MVRPRTTKPQNVKKCARPGAFHLSSLLLAEDLDDLVLEALLDVVGAALGRLAGADQPDQPGDAPAGDRDGDDEHREGEDDAHQPGLVCAKSTNQFWPM